MFIILLGVFQWLLSQIFAPVGLILGLPWRDSLIMGHLLSIKTVDNTEQAYSIFVKHLRTLEVRSAMRRDTTKHDTTRHAVNDAVRA